MEPGRGAERVARVRRLGATLGDGRARSAARTKTRLAPHSNWMRSARLRYSGEVGFIVAVAIVLVAVHVGEVLIIASIASAWAIVALVEWRVRRSQPSPVISDRRKRFERAGSALLLVPVPFLFLGGSSAWFLLAALALELTGIGCFFAARRAG